MLALVDGVPRTLNLAQALSHYIDHQIEVIQRRSAYRLEKARNRAHIVEGLLRAIDMLDAVIATIRASADRPEARTSLMAEPFSFTEVQATHILDMTLGRLTRLGRSELEAEMEELRATIAELEAILSDDAKLRGRHRDRNDRHPRQVRQPPPERHHPRPRRDGRGGPHLRRGDRRHDDPGRLHQVRGGRRLPDPGPGRTGRAGGPVEGGGPGQPGGAHLRPRLPAALLEPGQGLPPARARDPDEGPDGAGDGGDQPGAAGAERVDRGHHRDAGVLTRSVPGVRHRARVR